MVTWYEEDGAIRVEGFGLDMQGDYFINLSYTMYSYVPEVQNDSSWETPIVQHAESPLAMKVYKLKINVGNC